MQGMCTGSVGLNAMLTKLVCTKFTIFRDVTPFSRVELFFTISRSHMSHKIIRIVMVKNIDLYVSTHLNTFTPSEHEKTGVWNAVCQSIYISIAHVFPRPFQSKITFIGLALCYLKLIDSPYSKRHSNLT
jgi:hypothetical protein